MSFRSTSLRLCAGYVVGISAESRDECVTPMDVESLIPCIGALPPPSNKRRLHWLLVVLPRTIELIKLPPDVVTLFEKREKGQWFIPFVFSLCALD